MKYDNGETAAHLMERNQRFSTNKAENLTLFKNNP